MPGKTDLKRGRHPNALFKLIICGNGTVGKTKIARRIETGKYPEEGESTHGVQIYLTEEKSFAPGHPAVRLGIWDFAGQELYYQLHRLFFRRRAVYLVVFDRTTLERQYQPDPLTGRPDENRPLEYWLNDIRASAGAAPIVLVQNKLDEEGEIGLEGRLPKSFHDLPLVRISAKTGLRFNELLIAIHQAIARLPWVGMELPKSWWLVREDIMGMQQDKNNNTQILSKTAFVELAQRHELCANSEEALLAYLDGSGVVLYDRELFPDSVVINQQWALDAIYTILDRVTDITASNSQKKLVKYFQEACGRNNGKFLPADLPFDRYSEQERSLFLKIMRRAGICFKTNSKSEKGEDLYIMFQYLRPEPIPLVEDLWAARSASGIMAQRFVFPHQLHRGVFREVVRQVLPKTELKNLWQRGLLLQWNGATALVRVNYRATESYLEIYGAGSRHEVQHLQAAFYNLVVEQLQQSAAWEQRVFGDGQHWFALQNISDASEMEAKFALSVEGDKVENWQDLKWWLRMDKEANFDSIPEQRHEEEVEKAETTTAGTAAELLALKDQIGQTDDLRSIVRRMKTLLSADLQDTLTVVSGRVRSYRLAKINGGVATEVLEQRQSRLRNDLIDLINEGVPDDEGI